MYFYIIIHYLNRELNFSFQLIILENMDNFIASIDLTFRVNLLIYIVFKQNSYIYKEL